MWIEHSQSFVYLYRHRAGHDIRIGYNGEKVILQLAFHSNYLFFLFVSIPPLNSFLSGCTALSWMSLQRLGQYQALFVS